MTVNQTGPSVGTMLTQQATLSGQNSRWIRVHLFHVVCLLGCLFFLPTDSAQAAPQYKDCIQLFRAKSFSKAAVCFESVARSLNRPGLTKKQRTRKGRALRNAANLLERAAKQNERVEVAAYWRERAVKLLQQYLDESLYEVKYQKRGAESMKLRLQNSIGYATLTIVLTTPRASFVLKGFKTKIQGKGTWSRRLRPGPYRLNARFPLSGSIQNKRFYLSSGETKVVTLTPQRGEIRRKPPLRTKLVRRPPPPGRLIRRPPPPKPKRSKTAAWVTLGVGAAVLIGGGTLLLVANLNDNQMNSLYQAELKKQPEDRGADSARAITELNNSTGMLFPIGWTLLGVGAATAITGGVLFAVP